MHIWIAAALALPTASTSTQPGVDRPVETLDGAQHEQQASAEIVHGTRDTKFGATVALSFPQMGTFCSASMITPRVALTAAHCISGQSITPQLVSTYGSVNWGPDAQNPTQTARIIGAHPHPQYGSFQGAPTNDIAILEIEPVPYTPVVWINERPLSEADIGQEFTVVGFGITENGGNTSGTKRKAVVNFDELFNEFVVSNSRTNMNQAGICSGDSGGPMYGETGEGRYLQFAVHSWGEEGCRGINASTSTADYVPFITNHVERIHGSADMCDNRGANIDAVCDPECADDRVCAMQEVTASKACQTGSSAPLWFGGLALLGAVARRRR